MKTTSTKRRTPVIQEAKTIDGKKVIIDTKKKTCRIIRETEQTDFVRNLDVESLSADFEKANTKALFRYMQKDYPDATLNGKWITVADYKIRFSSHGYLIHDMRKAGEIINVNKWNNDYPDPEAVVEFIRKTVKRVPIREAKISRDEVTLGELAKMARIGKLPLKDAQTNEFIKLKSIKPYLEKPKDRLYMDFKRIFEGFVNNKYNYRDTLLRLKERAPVALHPELTKMLQALKNKGITYKKLVPKLDEMVHAYVAQKKSERPQRQPKFLAPFLYEPMEFPEFEIKDDICAVLTEKGEVMNVVMPDLTYMRFEMRGPNKQVVNVTTTLEGYLANVVLHNYPKAMALLMKVAKGEMVKPVFGTYGKSFEKDPFCKYEPVWLEHPVDRVAFCELCWDIIRGFGEGVITCFDLLYNKNFTVGMQVRVMNWDVLSYMYGEVISNEGGVEIRYEDGSTEYVLRHQTIVPFVWRKKK